MVDIPNKKATFVAIGLLWKYFNVRNKLNTIMLIAVENHNRFLNKHINMTSKWGGL